MGQVARDHELVSAALVRFVRARQDEREAAARALLASAHVGDVERLANRVLRNVWAERSIVDGCEKILIAPHEYLDAHDLARGVLARLALPDHDHPDYEAGWRPDGTDRPQ
jgi:Family of unknown function (DUF6221)